MSKEKNYREKNLENIGKRGHELNVPFEASESDTAVRIFYRIKMAEQTEAMVKTADSAARTAESAASSAQSAASSLKASIICAVAVCVSALCTVVSLIIFATRN